MSSILMLRGSGRSFPIVGLRFSPDEFQTYVAQLNFTNWRPKFVVVHNTAVPTLAMRPRGFTKAHMANLRSYYTGLGWPSGPHVFVDQNGIWVFSPLDRPGTHSPSWNRRSWGVELLGDYEIEALNAGPGALVYANAVSALAALHIRIDASPESMKFHREDPKTTHRGCPGSNLSKGRLITDVAREIERLGKGL
jgi:hypothetical protein